MGQRGFTPTTLLLLQLFPAWLPITGIQWNGGVGRMWRYPVPDGTWPTLTDRVWIKWTWWSRSSYSCWFYVFRTNEMDSISDQVKVRGSPPWKLAGSGRNACFIEVVSAGHIREGADSHNSHWVAYTGQEADPDWGASHLEKTKGVGAGLVDNNGIRRWLLLDKVPTFQRD